LAAYDFIANPDNYSLNREQKGVSEAQNLLWQRNCGRHPRMALMNLFLHNIGDFESDSFISPSRCLDCR
jgi:type I restriction enzyme M protein